MLQTYTQKKYYLPLLTFLMNESFSICNYVFTYNTYLNIWTSQLINFQFVLIYNIFYYMMAKIFSNNISKINTNKIVTFINNFR